MKKSSLFGLMVMIILFIVSPWAFAKDTMDAVYLPVGTLTLAVPRGVVPRRSAVAFPHSRHFDYTCKSCHHKWDGLSQVSGCTASGCHEQFAPNKGKKAKRASDPADKPHFRSAYHRKCIACHKRIKIERYKLEKSGIVLTKPLPRTGPIGCIECHPRN